MRVCDLFSAIHDYCQDITGEDPHMYYRMLRCMIRTKAVRGRDDAEIIFRTPQKWCDALDANGFSKRSVRALYDMWNALFEYLEDKDKTSSPHDNDGVCLFPLLGEDMMPKEIDVQTAWMAGYVTAMIYHNTQKRNN